MATEEEGKPIWVRSPISILFDAVKLQKTHPWDIDLRGLLEMIMAEIRRAGHIEFEASGVALLSSAIIFRRKSELLLKLEEPPKPPEQKEALPTTLPVAINLPVMASHGKIALSELAQALMEAISAQMPERGEGEMAEELPPLLEQPDEFMMNLERHMGELQGRIQEMLEGRDLVSFSHLTKGMDLQGAIRIFILLLFLASSGKIAIQQDYETREIWIGREEGGEGLGGTGRGTGEEDD
jgi:chromatin segregation and condensation protein Rec8/ScpA/Scc1 (kleisin family)